MQNDFRHYKSTQLEAMVNPHTCAVVSSQLHGTSFAGALELDDQLLAAHFLSKHLILSNGQLLFLRAENLYQTQITCMKITNFAHFLCECFQNLLGSSVLQISQVLKKISSRADGIILVIHQIQRL